MIAKRKKEIKKIFEVYIETVGTAKRVKVRVIGGSWFYLESGAYEIVRKCIGKDELLFAFTLLKFFRGYERFSIKTDKVHRMVGDFKKTKQWWRTVSKDDKIEITPLRFKKSLLV
jgi:hypothetical protein